MSGARRRILVFADWFLPGYRAGGPIRSLANLVEALEDEFYIVTRNCDHHEKEPYPGIPSGEWISRSSSVHVKYLSEGDVNRTFIRDCLAEVRPDVMYLNSLFSPRFSLLPLMVWKAQGRPCRLVLAPRGMLKSGALSLKSRKKRIFLTAARLSGLFRGIVWHATNEEEAAEIRRYFGRGAHVRIAPNLPARRGSAERSVRKQPGELRLVSIARISPEKGIADGLRFLAAAGLKGALRADYYGAHQNPAYLEECRKLAESIPGADIRFLGEIEPSAIGEALSENHFFYLPTWGENYGHAIAESILQGVPVIISDRTPWRDLIAQGAGWDLPLSEHAFRGVLESCMSMGQDEYAALCRHTMDYAGRMLSDRTAEEASVNLFS
jgi:glycosyltransferase involved in cell wall biosynthesis